MDIYKETAKIVTKLSNKNEGKSMKVLVYASKIKNKKVLMALVCGNMRYSDALMALSYRCTMLHKDPPIRGNEALLRVLLYEGVIGEGVSPDDQYKHYKRMIANHEKFIKDQWERLKRKKKVIKDENMVNDIAQQAEWKALPRWVRVNLLKTTVDEVVSHLEGEGYTLVIQDRGDYNSFVQQAKALAAREFMRDYNLSDVLVMGEKTELHDSILTQKAHIILQDKASCIPAHILCPPSSSHVLDACAAPGNKTSHLASLMNNDGEIVALDRDLRRCDTMRRLLLKAGVTCCTAVNQDFLKAQTTDPRYRDVEYILVDPSCTGSGIVNRVDARGGNSSPDDVAARITKLSNIQTMLLKHALSFPKTKRVVYSTCSVNSEENEQVVTEALGKFSNAFHLVEVLPELPRTAAGDFECSEWCLRLNPETDATTGFFVACFERIRECSVRPSDLMTRENIDSCHERRNGSHEVTVSKKIKKRPT